MKASELAVRIIEQIAIKGDFQIHPSTTLTNLFHKDKLLNMDYLDLEQVKELTHLSRSTIYLQMSNGEFPKPLKFGERKIRWKAEAIHKWLHKRKSLWAGK